MARARSDAADVASVDLQGELLSNASAIGQPARAEVAGATLWVGDAAGDPDLHVLDAESGELLRSLGRRGGGPGELGGAPANIQADPEGKPAVWAFDASLQRLVRFALEESDSARAVRVQGRELSFKAAWLSPRLGVGITRRPAQRFSFFDAEGKPVRAVPGELLGPDSIPIEAREQATMTRFALCVRPGGSHFAMVYAHAGRITIHDAELAATVVAAVPDPAEPTFERDDRTRTVTFQRTVMHYLGCSATADHLYALYSGMRYVPGRGQESNSGRLVHVFDWDGRLVTIMALQPAVTGIAADPGGSTLYGVSLDDAGIYRYRTR